MFCYGHAAYQVRTLYFCPVVSLSSFFIFLAYSQPFQDVYHSSTHGVASVFGLI